MHHPIARNHQALTICIVGTLLAGTAGSALATPTLLNLVPTADILGAGEVTVQFEADGHSWPCEKGGEYWLLTGVGIADRLEIGLDRSMPQDGDGEWFMDAKVLLLSETDSSPAVAVGALDLTDDSAEENWYVAGTKGFGNVRASAGYWRNGIDRIFLGASWDVCDRLTLLSDYSSGPDGMLTLGTATEVLPGVCGLLYFAQSNTAGADNYVGFNLAWNYCWK